MPANSGRQRFEEEPFAFKQLPPELRVQVYEYLFICELPLYVHHVRQNSYSPLQMAIDYYPLMAGNDRRTPTGPGFKLLRAKGTTALLRTNKLIHKEAMSVLYAQNTFIFQHADALRDFVRTAKSGVPLVRTVVLDIFASQAGVPTPNSFPTVHLHGFTGLKTCSWVLKRLQAVKAHAPRRAFALRRSRWTSFPIAAAAIPRTSVASCGTAYA